ncbi:MAG TPA: histidine kinase [Marmoricola sp.]|nr:histidine kinase [Marmoricola sp.]
MTRSLHLDRCTLQRSAGVLVWVPVLLLGPLLSLPDGLVPTLAAVALVLVLAASATSAALGQPGLAGPALLVLALAVLASTAFGAGWLPVWVLLAITSPTVLRGRWLLAGLALVVAGSVLAAWALGVDGTTLQVQGFVVSLSGAATTSFVRLTETVEELRRTRTELANLAVAKERERFSRDLHDLLGHTLSVMVVKAQAVRRLAASDPAAAAEHAADIEEVGRSALIDVRQAVDAMRAPSLSEELAGARRALEAAGIRATVVGEPQALPSGTEEALAWVVREGSTNVLRHSGAARCRIELSDGAERVTLTVRDDGVGGPRPPAGRQGGLEGLRRRMLAAGGQLEAGPDENGFRLVASVARDGR